MRRQTTLMLLKSLTALSLFTGIITLIFLTFFAMNQRQNSSSPTPTTTPTQVPKNKFCGGIAGIKCPEGYICKLSGNYPDAGGTCIKTIYCPQDIKMCPDGKTSIRRKPPTCEFEPCP